MCLAASQNAAKGKVTITSDIATQVVKNSLTEENLSHSAFNRKYGSNIRAAAIVYGEFVRINRDLNKMERFLQKNKELYQDLLKAFRDNQYEILTRSLEPGVHAEAQILAELLSDPYIGSCEKEEKQECYIGISKLCCLHCRVLLDSTNLTLMGGGINLAIKFRGRHDLDFTWIPPEAFRKGFDYQGEEINEKDDIYFRIGFATARTISELLLEKKPTGISQLPSPSSSETEITEEEKIKQYQANLLQIESILSSLPFESTKANKEAVSLGLELLSVEGFEDFFDESYKAHDAHYMFLFLIKGLENKGKQVNGPTLLHFLQNPLFCGKEIARYFQSYQLPDPSSKATQPPVIKFSSESATSSPPSKKLKSTPTDLDAKLSESATVIQIKPIVVQEGEEISEKKSRPQIKFTNDFFKFGMSAQESDTTDKISESCKENPFKK